MKSNIKVIVKQTEMSDLYMISDIWKVGKRIHLGYGFHLYSARSWPSNVKYQSVGTQEGRQHWTPFYEVLNLNRFYHLLLYQTPIQTQPVHQNSGEKKNYADDF